MVDVTEGTVFSLGISQTIDLGGFGLASGVAFGTAQLNASVTAGSVSGTAAVGVAKTDASVVAVGINAAVGVVGVPALTASMHPTSIASTAAIGDADTIATVFIIPGPVDPSNDFGNAQVFKKGWIFRTPFMTYQYRYPPQKQYEGISLLKESGVWSEIPHPDLARTLDAQLYLAGGRDHVVSTTLKAELEGLGYTVTEEAVTTEVVIS